MGRNSKDPIVPSNPPAPPPPEQSKEKKKYHFSFLYDVQVNQRATERFNAEVDANSEEEGITFAASAARAKHPDAVEIRYTQQFKKTEIK